MTRKSFKRQPFKKFLSLVVAFTTAYSLINPALAIDAEETEREPETTVEETTVEEVPAEEPVYVVEEVSEPVIVEEPVYVEPEPEPEPIIEEVSEPEQAAEEAGPVEETEPAVTEEPEPGEEPVSFEEPAEEESVDISVEKGPAENAEENETVSSGTKTKVRLLAAALPSSDLKDYIYNAEIRADINPDTGAYMIKKGTTYQVSLSFKEDYNRQFPENGDPMTYALPAGFDNTFTDSGQISIDISYPDPDTGQSRSATINGNTYSISNGVITFNWNTNDLNFTHLTDSTNVSFNLNFYGKFDGSETQLDFGQNITKEIEFDDTHKVTVNKDGYFDTAAKVFRYTVTVTSEGTNSNVVVTDTIDGTAFVYQGDAAYSGNSSTPTGGTSANGFQYTFPTMNDGETITFSYTAKIDSSKLNPAGDGGVLTVDESQNTATVKSDEDPEEDVKKKDFSYQKYTSLNKNGIFDADNGIVTWTITANSEQMISLKGSTISDQIAADSQQYLEYSGTGITVVVTKEDNTTETRNISWAEVGMSGAGDYNWTYTIPDSDTGNYKYEITYTTEVDDSSLITTTNVSNTAEGLPGSSTGSSKVGPSTPLSISKTHTELTGTDVTWSISFVLPANRTFDSAVLTDTYPTQQGYIDTFSELISVDGLTGNESYTLDTSDSSKFTMTFYKDSAKTVPGLESGNEERTVTVTFKTVFNSEWVERAKTDTWMKEHVNNASLNVNGKIVTASHTVVPANVTVAKTSPSSSTVAVDGTELPLYKYEVVIGGVTSDSITIEDVFDTSILKLYEGEVDDINNARWFNLRIVGGSQYYQGDDCGLVSYTSTDTGVTFTGSGLQKSDGTNYEFYKLTYYLVVKDKNALVNLQKQAAENDDFKATLRNTATTGGNSDDVEVQFEYEPLVKTLLNESELGGNNRTARFSIILNPAETMLNNGEDYTLTDTFSDNLNILYDTIAFDNPDAVVTYNVSGHTATYTIKDGKSVTITYSAVVLGTGPQTINNEAEAAGYTDFVTSSKEYGSSGGGSGDILSIKILKHETDKMERRLEGAKFQLFEKDGDVPVKNGAGFDYIITTNAQGLATVSGSSARLYPDMTYYLKEIEAPSGYEISDIKWEFTLTTDPAKVDTWNYIYPNGYTMRITNTPKTAGIILKKTFSGSIAADDLTEDQKKEIIFTVTKPDSDPDDEVDDSFNETYTYDQFTDGEYSISGLSAGTYTVTESAPNIDGLIPSITYKVDAEEQEGEAASVEITADDIENTRDHEAEVVNTYTPQAGTLKLTKNVTVNGTGTEDTLADGRYAFTVVGPASAAEADRISRAVVIVIESGKVKSATVDGTDAVLNDGYVAVSGLTPGEYSITETVPTNGTSISKINGTETASYSTTVTVAAGTTAEDTEAVVTFTNNINTATADLSVTKICPGLLLPSDEYVFTFELTQVVAFGSEEAATENVKLSDSIQKTTDDGIIEDHPDNDIEIPFGADLQFTDADAGKTFYFMVEEIIPEEAETSPYIYDGIQYPQYPEYTRNWITITVSKGEDGGLVITKKYGESDIATGIAIYNEKLASLVIKKNFEGSYADKLTNEQKAELKFTVKGEEGTVVSDYNETFAYGEDDPDRFAVWTGDSLKIENLRIGTYIVTESGVTTEGVPYTHSATYSVSSTETSDKAEVDVVQDNTMVEITNTYNELPIVPLKIRKALAEGSKWPAGAEAEFTITPQSGAPEPEETTVTLTEAGEGSFGNIALTLDDAGKTYIYTISETKGFGDGWTKSGDVTATVTVSDVSDSGEMTATVTYTDNDTITNTYSAEGTGEIKVQKVLEGRDWTDEDEFTFTLSAESGTPMPAETSITIKKSDTDQTKSFGEITFTEAGTYTYTVKETIGQIGGITYDETEHTVIIKVVDDGNGNLIAEAGDTLVKTEVITNTYAAEGEEGLTGKKVLNGKTLEADQFTFSVTPDSENPSEGIDESRFFFTARNDAGGNIDFGTLSFTDKGTWKYTVKETSTSGKGITVDRSEYQVTFVVTDVGDGSLDVEKLIMKTVDKDGNVINEPTAGVSIEFENDYSAEGEIQLHATKEFAGRDWTEEDAFEFTLAADSSNPNGAELPETLTKTATVNEKTVTFDAIKFTAEGTYTFTITETVPEGAVDNKKDGITYDSSPKNITVTVTDNGEGELEAVATPENATVTAENTYSAEGTGEIKVQKVLEGRDWTDEDEFTFTLSAESGTPMPAETSITIKKSDTDQTKSFGEITFTKAGTYTYTVKESKGTIGGITYDETEHTVTIKVVDDGKGNLIAEEGDTLIKTETVTNTYGVSGRGEVKVQKKLEGRDWTDEDEFTFTLSAESGTPMPAETSITIKKSDTDQTKSFGEITFTEAGTYTYTVKETIGQIGGITYDETEHTVIIKVVDDGNGNLIADKESSLIQVEQITNTYSAEGTGEIKVQKKLEGRDWTDEDEFTFTLSAESGTPMPAETSITIKKSDTDQTKSFGEITFTEAGTYTYTVKETIGTIGGITYDETEHTVMIKIVDDGNGNLIAEEGDTLVKTEVITNTYTAEGSASLKINKALADGDTWPSGANVEFTLSADNDTPMPDAGGEKVTMTAAGEKSFGEIAYTLDDVGETYTYTIAETKDFGDGWTVSGTVTATVTVSDNGDGTLAAAITYSPNDYTVTNDYSSEGIGEIKVQKVLKGRDWTDEDEFTFTLSAESGTPMPAETSITIKKSDTDQTKSFGEITFTEAGTYTYTVKESKGTAGGIAYDETEHTVVLEVVDDGKGNLIAEGGDTLIKTETVTNTYSAQGTSGQVKVKKVLEGRDWTDEDVFTFTITPIDNAPAVAVPTQVTITSDNRNAEVPFGSIAFKAAGTYEYEVEEVHGSLDGVTYDATVHNVTFRIVDNGEGQLVAEEGTQLAFTEEFENTFEAVTAEIEVTKEFEDWDKADSFTFYLAAVTEKAPLPESQYAVATASEKTVSFGELTYEKAGTYEYTVTEVNSGEDGVSYDTTPHTVRVVVSRDETTNRLSAKVEYEETSGLIITNTYAPATAEIEVTKAFEDWGKADSFTFSLEAVTQDAPMPDSPTAVATARETTVSFGELTYEKAGTYEYMITEVNDGADGVTYDTTPHTVIVEVIKANDATNELTAEVTYDGAESLVITNTFTPVTANITAVKEFNRWGVKESFEFELEAVTEKAPLPNETTATATKDTPADFGTMTFEKAGTYEYTVTEINDGAKGIAYDTEPHNVTVEVTKDQDTNALSAEVIYEDGDTVIIVNEYDAEGEIVLEGVKRIENRSFEEGDTAEFTITALSEDTPLPEETAVVIEPTEGGEYQFSFGEIKYRLSDLGEENEKTFEYQVKETAYTMRGTAGDTAVRNVKVTVRDNGDGTLEVKVTEDSDPIEFINTYIEVRINKYDSDGKEVNGAVLTLFDADTNEELISWTSKAGEHCDLSDLMIPGKSYVLKETKTPAGYYPIDDIAFSVTEAGTIEGPEELELEIDENGAFKLIDAKINITVDKVDGENKPLSGAVLAVKDKDGKIVDQWTTDGRPHVIMNLEANSTYTLTELKVPEGYTRAADITFSTGNKPTAQALKMVDKKSPIPYTGDSNHSLQWTLTMMASLLLAGFCFVLRRRVQN